MRNKNEQIGFRVSAATKRALEEVARREARTLSQICEIFVMRGLDAYEREGPKSLQRFLAQRKKASEEKNKPEKG